MSPTGWYAALVAAGFALIAVEVFLPGGVIGAVGGVCLLIAAYQGFEAFGTEGGWLALGGLLLALALFLPLWMRISPKTRMGKKLTLTHDEKGFVSPDPQLVHMEGREGMSVSALKPGGIAQFGDRRVDVVSSTGFIPAGRRVRVIRTEGVRVIVQEIGQA